MAHLEYHFDIVCPYAYLGSTQITSICEKHQASLSWHPVLLGGILKSVEVDPMFTTKLSPAKAQHNVLDMYRHADMMGVPFQFNPLHPIRTVKVQRALVVAEAPPVLIKKLYDAYWVDSLDLSQESELKAVLDDAGCDGQAILEEIENPAVKAQLRQATDDVVARGAFGVPAMFVGNELVWGQDRLHFVERLLEGGQL
ncbi:MAG: disulfide bond formation protein DsbA [Myxococcales bacterium]|nr:disulfide bond formation protein DsbA [Myxococcales bacterium]